MVKTPATALLAALILTVGVFLGQAAAQEKVAGPFLTEFINLLKSQPETVRIVSFVKQHKANAEKGLAYIDKRIETDPGKKEALLMVRGKLQDALMLAKQGKDCSEGLIKELITKSKEQRNSDDKALFLEKAVELCPEAREPYGMLGALYLQERQFGMAVSSLEKAVKLGDDPREKELLKEAKDQYEQFKKAEPITVAKAQELFQSSALMAPIPGKLTQDVQIRKALQTNRILFEPWSSKLKTDYAEEIDAVGKALKDAFDKNKSMKLVVEGHADQSGAEEKNLDVSRKRAEAIKERLVKEYGLDPSRIDAKGYGFFKPFAPNDTEENKKLNRRVEFKQADK